MVATFAPYQNSPEGTYSLRKEIAQDSSYTLKDAAFVAPPTVDSIVQRAVEHISAIQDPRMLEEARRITREFRLAAIDVGIDLSDAPPLEVVDADDGSVLIEWQFEDRRMGFNIEPAKEQSGWYYVFSKSSGGQCGSGTLESLDMRMLIRLMLGPAR